MPQGVRVPGLRALAASTALAPVAAIALSGCSGGGGLDVAALQRSITAQARVAYPALAPTATTCRGVSDQRPFVCSVRTATAPLRVRVRPAPRGRVTVDTEQTVFATQAASAFVIANGSLPSLASCGTGSTIVADPGTVVPCDVTFTDGTKQSAQLRVLDAAGSVRLETPGAPGPTGAPATPGGTVSWSPIGRAVLGRPSTFGAQAEGVGLAWLDPQLLHPVLVAGTSDPPGSPGPWGGQVPPAQRPALAAAFNSGFKLGDVRGGWVGWGTVWRAPENGDASLVVATSGQATVGVWGRDVSGGPDVAYVRQNLTLLVDGGAPVASAGNPGAWGASISGANTWRSALGVDAHGALVFAAGGGITPAVLARALVAAGVQRAMELDINPSWVSFNTYQPGPDGVHGTKVYGLHANDRYLSPDSRDFIALLVRPVVQSGATAKLAGPPLHATVKASTS
jgi:hypothetical protein